MYVYIVVILVWLWMWPTWMLLIFFSPPDCWCLFIGIVVHQLWSSAFSRKHEVWAWGERSWEWRITFFNLFFIFLFFSKCDGALPGLGALRKQHTLHISIVNIAQTGPQGHFSVGPQRGRGSSPPPCARHWAEIYLYLTWRTIQDTLSVKGVQLLVTEAFKGTTFYLKHP